jgi:hypothetical protein
VTAGHYRVDGPNGSWWALSWDSSIGSYEAMQLTVDRNEVEQILAWHGAEPGELASLDELRDAIGVDLPVEIADRLRDDADALPASGESLVGRRAGAPSRLGLDDESTVTEARLARWEADLARRERELENPQSTQRRSTLPAAPATHVLRQLISEPGFSTDDVATFARGLGMDARVTDDLLTGRMREVTIEQISALCEGLHCSPFDLWGAELARTVLHAYGPERWPRYIEPLGDGDLPSNVDNTFLQRRLDQQAAEVVPPSLRIVQDEVPGPSNEVSTEADVTAYRRAAVLAWTASDGPRVVSTSAPPDPAAEYHFSFRQVTEPVSVAIAMSSAQFASAPLPGFDTVPELQTIAATLRARGDAPDAELVRFVDRATGAEQWLGWDPAAGQWQSWDDPRRYYPGDSTDVLDAGAPSSAMDLEPEPLGIGVDL